MVIQQRLPAIGWSGKVSARLQDVASVATALRLVWNCSPTLGALNLAVLAVGATLPFAALFTTKLLIDTLTVSTGIALSDRNGTVANLVLLLGGIALAGAIIESAGRYVGENQVQRVTERVLAIMHRKASSLDLGYYDNSGAYDDLHRAQQEAAPRIARVSQSLFQLGQSALLLGAAVVFLTSLHWATGLVVAAVALPASWLRARSAAVQHQLQRSISGKERRAQYYGWQLTLPLTAKEIRLFGLAELFIERHAELLRSIREMKARGLAQRSLWDLASQLVIIIPVYALYWNVAMQAASGAVTIGVLVVFYQAFQRMQAAGQSAIGSLGVLQADAKFLDDFQRFLAIEPSISDPELPCDYPSGDLRLSLESVSFTYPTSDRAALNGVSFQVKTGELVALVGENGCGKSTLVKLLCRLYDPDSGAIRVNGSDLRSFRVADVRSNCAVLFQDFARYELSARENIWLGQTLQRDDARLVKAAEQSGAADVIGQLPNGYESMLGTWIERGSELSIGQWQKVALARTFYREAPIVILDEPSSAMDPNSEHEMMAAFRELLRGKAGILISHRLSSARLADRILVMHDGQIIESGSHDELMAQDGHYSRLFRLQADGYRSDA